MSSARAVLFDRDGTLVEDVPYNGDPNEVRPLPGVRQGLDKLRARGLLLGVVTNQSGVGRGYITMQDVQAVNTRIDRVLGSFDGWFVCPHAPGDDCECRKPKPKLVLDAARAFGVAASDVVLIGDKPSDVEAARNAGAQVIFLPDVAGFGDAVDRILNDRVADEPA